MSEYDPKKIEKKWQDHWSKSNLYQVVEDCQKEKLYVLVEFPYPSGDGLHVGHTRSYTALDSYSRKKRMEGYNVLYPIGYDAFGLPTENYAIKTGQKPLKVTEKNIKIFRQQMRQIGFSFDWSREIDTSDPNYYKWTQWIFLQFYKHGFINGKLIEISNDDKTTLRLAYQDEIAINWCPSCRIGLANEEVVGGKCERCGSETEKRMQKQWMLRITAYADRLINDLDGVNYLEKIKTGQINWIGKSKGSNIKFQISNSKFQIDVFTTRTDTLFGCTYVVLAPENPLLKNLKNKIQNLKDVEKYVEKSKKKSDLERTEIIKEKTGVELKGIKAINPINNREVSVWIADYVLSHYGTGAVMAVPAHDERDFEFAQKYNLPISFVIYPKDNKKIDKSRSFDQYGVLKNSGEFSEMASEEAKIKITEKLKSRGMGDFDINYKLRDWVFSRQHYWGEPIPLIKCEKCGIVPVPEENLPVELPDVEKYQPTDTGESPLSKIKEWVNTKCPKCNGQAIRETDTMPNWAGSSWYFLRYCDPDNAQKLAAPDKLKYWMPVDLYNGGMEHTTLHLLYSRFWYKFLSDLKVVPGIEPYQRRISHGMILGANNQKMSKSLGNVVNPDTIVNKYGADTLRTYILFIGPYEGVAIWNTSNISGISRFLKRLWKVTDFIANEESEVVTKFINQSVKKITSDYDDFHFNTVISTVMEIVNIVYKEKKISRKSFEIVLKIFFPIAPFITSELFSKCIAKKPIDGENWPKYNKLLSSDNEIEIPIQINGKIRDKLLVPINISESEIKKIALLSDKVQKWLNNKTIKKFIYIKNKIVSFVI